MDCKFYNWYEANAMGLDPVDEADTISITHNRYI